MVNFILSPFYKLYNKSKNNYKHCLKMTFIDSRNCEKNQKWNDHYGYLVSGNITRSS